MQPSRFRSLGFLLLPLLALDCAKPRFVYDVDPAFKNGAFHSVAADPRRDRIVIREGMRPLNPELHLRAALVELEARKYQPTNPDEADLWVAAFVLISGQPEGGHSGEGHHEGSGEGRHGGRGGGGKGGGPSDSGAPGKALMTSTIIVQLEDRKTGRPIWHGETHINAKDRDTDGSPLSIEAAVRQLLQPLPSLP